MAQTYPSRPVTLVVPYPAGGGADIIGRMLAEAMKPALGQPVTVTNRPGGQGTIGTAEVLRSAPDGYNIVLSAVATLTVQPHRQDLPYNSPDDYDPIIKVANLPMVLAVQSTSPWKSAKELMEYLRANPGKIRVGTPGNGSIGHLIVASVNSKAGVRLAHVPYASGAESIPSLLGGADNIMIGRVVWDEMFSSNNWPRACALSISMIVLVIAPLAWFNQRVARKTAAEQVR